MKKMTKGAIVTGLGVALLLGGGGTLAVWNDSVESNAGTLASGNLDLEAKPGVWTNGQGEKITVESYRVVPGEMLTYTQVVNPTLDGDKLQATLEVTGVETLKAHNSKNITVTEPTLTNAEGQVLPSTVLTKANTEDQPVTASTTFAFSLDADKQENTKDTWDFSEIGYYLEQQAPTS
ncbi:alternate-type signal peptide domain-containing protein [Citricoccus sp. NPDC079358]|uniref:alternate-type signal peptide domain-containing protein n=1 Tax=Citricoccus sp. NPDC079358 TaxID=3154653 RepID=UPI00344F2DAC